MTTTIESVLDRIAEWRGRNVRVQPIPAGLTNRNFRVDVDEESYVVRIPGKATELLAIDRANERHNTAAAAETGVAPRIVHYVEDLSVMVLERLDARTMSIAALQEPGMPTKMGEAIGSLHRSRPFQLDFNMFRLIENYLEVCRTRSIPIPQEYPDALPVVTRMEQALWKRPLPPVPCHNDLLAENYLELDGKLRLIDFEYSGNNDPCFELGNTCQENLFDDSRVEEMCAAYFGRADQDKLARMRLYMLLSDVGWTLWGAIQARVSTIEYDFWGWSQAKWQRALRKFSSPQLEEDLARVAVD